MLLHSVLDTKVFCSLSPIKTPNPPGSDSLRPSPQLLLRSHTPDHSLRPSPQLLSPHSPQLILRFPTSDRENFRYLKSLGVIDPRTKRPSPETLTQILFTVNFLKSKGFSDPDFSRLAFLCPDVFSGDFSPTQLEAVFDFLAVDVGASPEESLGLILRCPTLLQSNAQFCLRPTLLFLRELGVVEKLNSPSNFHAHLLNTRIGKLKMKVWFLRSIGFSYEEAASACARMPAIFGYSIENNMRPKFNYLVREMKRGVEELKEFPRYFAYSLVKRIVPRHLHLNQRNVEIPLPKMLVHSDQKFYDKWK